MNHKNAISGITLIVGSSNNADIILNSRYVDSEHMKLTEENGRYFLEDLDTTFGTHVNGKKIEGKVELNDGDQVKLGIVLFHWQLHIEHNNDVYEKPIYLKDLFTISGTIKWQDFKIILLLALGAIIIIPIAIPLVLLFIENKLSTSGQGIQLIQYAEILLWLAGLVASYIFINLTQKMIRGLISDR